MDSVIQTFQQTGKTCQSLVSIPFPPRIPSSDLTFAPRAFPIKIFPIEIGEKPWERGWFRPSFTVGLWHSQCSQGLVQTGNTRLSPSLTSHGISTVSSTGHRVLTSIPQWSTETSRLMGQHPGLANNSWWVKVSSWLPPHQRILGADRDLLVDRKKNVYLLLPTIFPTSKTILKFSFIPWYSKVKNTVLTRIQNVMNISNNGSIVSLEMRSRMYFRLDNCSFRCLASFPWGSHPMAPRGLATGDEIGDTPGNLTLLIALQSSEFIEWLSRSVDSCSLITVNVLAQVGFISKNFALEFPLVSEIESCTNDVLRGWHWPGVEIIGVNRIFTSFPFEAFSPATFSFLSLTVEYSPFTLFISVTWEPHGE